MSDSHQLQSLLMAAERETEKRLRRVWALSPEERLVRFSALQKAAWTTLNSNSLAMREFHRRNTQQRRLSNVARLLDEMTKNR